MKSLLPALLFAALLVPAAAQEKKNTDKASDDSVKTDEKKDKPVKTRVVKAVSRNPNIATLELKVPVTWKDKRSASRMRSATLTIPAAKGDKEAGEMSVIILGPQSVDDNVDRWVGQFASAGRKQKVTKGKLKKGDYYMVDLSGTYKKPVGPPIMRKTEDTPGYRMLAVMIPTKGGAYFLKLTGPEKTVAAQVSAFRKSFGGDAKTEKPYSRS